jgi:hypothetical protein
MKIINGKSYIEVIAMESKLGKVSTNEATMTQWMALGQVKKCVDKSEAKLLAKLDEKWKKLSESKVVMYYCEADRTSISALDIDYSYMVDSAPTTAYELIMMAQRKVDREIFDTKLAARALAQKGYSISTNPTPTKKYSLR